MSLDELQQVSRKILLVHESCALHLHLDSLKNNHLEFLPSDPTSLVLPNGRES